MTAASAIPDPMLTTQQAADYLGVKPDTLVVWRCTKRHQIAYAKIGRAIRYRKSALDSWLASRTVGANTPEQS